MQKERYNYITVLRAVAIAMVIALHCICDYFYDFSNAGRGLWYLLGYTDEFLRIGVPVFFMISGFLLMKDDITDIKAFYKKRLLKVFIPFIFYDVFYYLFKGFQGEAISVAGFFKDLLNNGSSYHFWFVYSIMFIYLLMPFLQKIVKQCSTKMLWLLLCLVTFQTTIRPFINTIFDGKVYIYFTEDGFIGYIGYVILGYILGTCDFTKKQRLLIYALGVAAFAVFPAVNMLNIINKQNMLITGGYTINHYIEAMALFLWFKYNVKGCNRFISRLSALSFTAYLIHVFILSLIQEVSFDLNPSLIMLIWMVACVVLSFGWAYVENAIIKVFRRG